MKYTIKGYTGPYPDFSDTIALPAGFDFNALTLCADMRYNESYNKFKSLLIDTACSAEYLDVLDIGSFELREDLAEDDKQIVIVAEAYGCDHCQEQGHGEYTDGCDDTPHGGYMLVLDPEGDRDE